MADSAVATPRSALQPAGKPRALAQRVALAMEGLGRIGDDLAKYEYLVGLLDRDPRLFFATLEAHTSTIVPLVYTPVVGAACQQWSHLLAPAKGLYISLDDAGRVAELLRQWPAASVRAICVTDGGRILGLGDLGANGMGIPVGKLALYSGLAGVDPAVTLPVTLDVGTDNEELLADPVYCGLRRRREGGPAYYALVKEFVAAVLSVFGPDTLVQWEDFNNASAFKILDDYKQVVPSFNDDIEGTASVVVAGLLSAAKHMEGVPSLADGRYLFFGAGEAGVGIADLLTYAIALESRQAAAAAAAAGAAEVAAPLTVEQARQRIWLVDTRGLVTAERAAAEGAKFAAHKRHYAHALEQLGGNAEPPSMELASIVAAVRPTALIGVSAQPATFTEKVVGAMVDSVAGRGARPVIFALSNPTSKAECTAEQAYTWTQGAAVFASGSPFDAVSLARADGSTQTLVPAQANNAYIFPALGLATLAVRMRSLPEHTMYTAAAALAGCADGERVRATGCLFPPLADILTVSHTIATAVAADAYECGLARLEPRPADLPAHIKASMWSPHTE